MDNKEKRKNERLPIEMKAEIYLPEKGIKIYGRTKNISFGGAFVLTDMKTSAINKGEHLVLSIILQKKPAEVTLPPHMEPGRSRTGTRHGFKFHPYRTGSL